MHNVALSLSVVITLCLFLFKLVFFVFLDFMVHSPLFTPMQAQLNAAVAYMELFVDTHWRAESSHAWSGFVWWLAHAGS
jgi:hypothetical protein